MSENNDSTPMSLDERFLISVNQVANDNKHSRYSTYHNLTPDLEKLLFLLDIRLSGGKVTYSEDGPAPWLEDTCRILQHLLATCKENGIDAVSIVIETNKFDDYYRDAYYKYHAAKHYPFSRECICLYIFKGDINQLGYRDRYTNNFCKKLDKVFLGYLTLTPLNGCNISKSILSPSAFIPDDKLKDATVRVCPYYCTMYGRHLNISGFPFMKQDSETGSCAETTALLITDYFSQKFQSYRSVSPSDILSLADTYSPQRGTPSQGLQYNVLSHVLKDIGFQPLLIEVQREVAEDIHFLLHCYLDSNIPVAVQISGESDKQHIEHSICCIGFGAYSVDEKEYSLDISLTETDYSPGQAIELASPVYLVNASSFCSDYYVMDDNDIPYKQLHYSVLRKDANNRIVHSAPFSKTLIPMLDTGNTVLSEKYRISNMIVPLDKDMRMMAVDARDIFCSFLSGYTGITRYLSNLGQFNYSSFDVSLNSNNIPGTTSDNPLIIRVFLAPSHKLKTRRAIEFSNIGVYEAAYYYTEIPMPKYVWICELYTKESFAFSKAIGELVLDATSSLKDAERSIILVHYPNLFAGHYPNDVWTPQFWKEKLSNASEIANWMPFGRFYFGNTYQLKNQDPYKNPN